MASTPNYEAGRRYGSTILNSGSGTTITSAVLTGASTNTRVREIRVYSGPTTAPGSGVLAVIHDDGTNQTVIEVVTLNNTANALQAILRYDNVNLVGTGQSIKFQMRTAITSGGTVHCAVYGADY